MVMKFAFARRGCRKEPHSALLTPLVNAMGDGSALLTKTSQTCISFLTKQNILRHHTSA